MDYDSMTSKQLVHEYNQIAAKKGLKLVNKFESMKVGLQRIKKLLTGGTPVIPAPEPVPVTPRPAEPSPSTQDPSSGGGTLMEKTPQTATDDEITRDLHCDGKNHTAPILCRSGEWRPEGENLWRLWKRKEAIEPTIRLKCQGNPRKKNSDGYVFFAAMTDGGTVESYLAKFPGDRKKAGQWLRNTVRDGYAEIIK